MDRFGTKAIFLVCHFGYGAVLFLFLGRNLAPASAVVGIVSVLSFLYGLMSGLSSIAITTEFMAQLLVPMPMPGFGSSDLIKLTSEAVYRCEWTGR